MYIYKLKMPVSMQMMLAFPFSNIYNKGFWYHSSICLSDGCQYLIFLVVVNMDANKMMFKNHFQTFKKYQIAGDASIKWSLLAKGDANITSFSTSLGQMLEFAIYLLIWYECQHQQHIAFYTGMPRHKRIDSNTSSFNKN